MASIGCSRRLAIWLASLLAAVAVVLSGPPNARASSQSIATSHGALGLLEWELSAYAGPLGGYRNGFWNSSNTICWSCNQGGPASAAATAYMLSGRTQPALLGEAEGTIDTAIATRQRSDGAFLGPPGDTQSPDVATMFFGDELGNAYLALLPVLDPGRRARWQAALTAAAQFLVHNGNLTWYTNGNINLGNAELFYLAWRATGNPLYNALFNQAWNFALNPPQSQWPGRGLRFVTSPKRSDWSDGAGYLTETGAGGTGFDPEYTSLQLDVAARLYLLSGDQRALRLANVLVNMLLPHVTSSFWLDTSGGTRHTETSRYVPLLTSAFAVLGLDGGRADLLHDIAPALAEEQSTILAPWNAFGEVYRRGLGTDVSVIALAAGLARPVGWAAAANPIPKPPGAAPAPATHPAPTSHSAHSARVSQPPRTTGTAQAVHWYPRPHVHSRRRARGS
jgi:hypothetical protein